MRKTILFLLALILFQGVTKAQTANTLSLSSELVPDSDDPEIKNLQWNRYVNENYVILSIDDNQGKWLCSNIKNIASICLNKWGLKGIPLSKECRIFCVPNKSLLKKLFNLDESKAEVRRDDAGDVKINVIWICLDSLDSNLVLPYLNHIVFYNDNEYPFWFVRGAEILSQNVPHIKNKLSEFDASKFFSLDKLLSLNSKEYSSLSKDEKEIFDKQSLLLCLMLRKELGQNKLLSFIGSSDSAIDSLKKVYGYKDLEDFSNKYKMYYNDLTKQIKSNKVPDVYFLIPYYGGD